VSKSKKFSNDNPPTSVPRVGFLDARHSIPVGKFFVYDKSTFIDLWLLNVDSMELLSAVKLM
jgi:hypothetical protein